MAGFYYAVLESVLESIGLQKRCSVLTVAASLTGLCCTLFLGGVLRLGIHGYLCGELLSALLGGSVCLVWVLRNTGLSLRLGNWIGRPLLASATAAALMRLVFSRLWNSGVAQPLAVAFSAALFFLLYTVFLRGLGTDFWTYTQHTLLRENHRSEPLV